MSRRNDNCTQARVAQLLSYDPDTGILRWKPRSRSEFASERVWSAFRSTFAGEIAGGLNWKGYRTLRIDGRRYQCHRLIWLLVHGTWPANIDHINGNRDDNRIANLRSVSNVENCHNQKRRRTKCALGVYQSQSGNWFAEITSNGHKTYLGMFPTYEGALAARKRAERKAGFHPNHNREAA